MDRDPRVSAEVVSMLEHLPDPAILLSTAYEILATNHRYIERYGEPPAGERRCFAVSHRYSSPCDENGESCPLRACSLTRQPSRVTHVHHTPRGPEHCDIFMKPVFDEEGTITAFVEQIRPIEIAGASPGKGGMLGRARAFLHSVEMIERVAPRETPVLLLGESGTGKELAARAIHERSARQDQPFVPVECSGLSATLFESELFGYERGAFTGARQRRDGLVDAARGGTLFLDEIGDIPLAQQAKLLRLLESGTYRRVGGTEPLRADFRLVCATWHDLRAMVERGEFRRDLYYRINVFPIRLPPLRDRTADIGLLSEAILRRLGARKRLHPRALAVLSAYDFPGNIRELRNILERGSLLADGPQIDVAHLPEEVSGHRPAQPSAGWPWGDTVLPLAEVEHRYLHWAARQISEGRRVLADRLGLSERTLYRKLQASRDESKN